MVQNDAGTNAVIAADSATPKTRNGNACTQIATKIVAHVCNAGAVRCGARARRPTTSRTTTSANPHGKE
ncbi:hypothetical protein AB0G15_40355 [Streptosporangium sp. NPDC023825]|uniref:hypothetical protein n=1 Tax=Streptosporangium sp. NPDC023825 TaxID=3154909 RepID=UPI003433AD8E